MAEFNKEIYKIELHLKTLEAGLTFYTNRNIMDKVRETRLEIALWKKELKKVKKNLDK